MNTEIHKQSTCGTSKDEKEHKPMVFIRLSGHSGAGKSRLTAALVKSGTRFRRPVICTSRAPRSGEVHGRDYYFMSRGSIASLPTDRFLVGNVRQSVQAIDLAQLEFDLRSGEPVIVEIFHTRWPPLKEWLTQRFGKELKVVSVFLTAIAPASIANLPQGSAESHVRDEIGRMLAWRGKDSSDERARRAETAVTEILQAFNMPGLYDRVIQSAPEGPDGKDDWTRTEEPQGLAAQVYREFLELLKTKPQQ